MTLKLLMLTMAAVTVLAFVRSRLKRLTTSVFRARQANYSILLSILTMLAFIYVGSFIAMVAIFIGLLQHITLGLGA